MVRLCGPFRGPAGQGSRKMDAAAWIAVIAAGISLGGIIPASLQVKSMKQQTEIQQEQTRLQAEIQKDSQRPFVWLDLRVNPRNGWILQLVLKNEGPTVATNIRIDCDPPIQYTTETSRQITGRSPGVFETGVTSMPPGREMVWSLGASHDMYSEKRATRHKVRISFDGPFGPEKPLEYTLDFQENADQTSTHDGSLVGIEKAIKEISKSNGPIATVVKAINNLDMQSRMSD